MGHNLNLPKAPTGSGTSRETHKDTSSKRSLSLQHKRCSYRGTLIYLTKNASMEVIKFKTNINNQDDLAKVSPYLNGEERISRWKIDIESPDKILSVSGKDLNPQAVKNAVERAGFYADTTRVIGLNGSDL